EEAAACKSCHPLEYSPPLLRAGGCPSSPSEVRRRAEVEAPTQDVVQRRSGRTRVGVDTGLGTHDRRLLVQQVLYAETHAVVAEVVRREQVEQIVRRLAQDGGLGRGRIGRRVDARLVLPLQPRRQILPGVLDVAQSGVLEQAAHGGQATAAGNALHRIQRPFGIDERRRGGGLVLVLEQVV